MTENKEFDLSEKIVDTNCDDDVLAVEDVREFIKICLADGWEIQLEGDSEDFKKGVQAMKETIVRYAGEKLK